MSIPEPGRQLPHPALAGAPRAPRKDGRRPSNTARGWPARFPPPAAPGPPGAASLPQRSRVGPRRMPPPTRRASAGAGLPPRSRAAPGAARRRRRERGEGAKVFQREISRKREPFGAKNAKIGGQKWTGSRRMVGYSLFFSRFRLFRVFALKTASRFRLFRAFSLWSGRYWKRFSSQVGRSLRFESGQESVGRQTSRFLSGRPV